MYAARKCVHGIGASGWHRLRVSPVAGLHVPRISRRLVRGRPFVNHLAQQSGRGDPSVNITRRDPRALRYGPIVRTPNDEIPRLAEARAGNSFVLLVRRAPPNAIIEVQRIRGAAGNHYRFNERRKAGSF